MEKQALQVMEMNVNDGTPTLKPLCVDDDEKDGKTPTDLFSRQHVQLVCENLISAGKYDRLDRFLWAVPNLDDFSDIEVVLVAQAYLAFRSGKFEQLYELLQQKNYSKKFHHQLQYLWRTARYIEAEKTRGRVLGSVGKYRIRRKYPLPYTIWDGECISYCFREEAREVLNKAYDNSPYPTATEKYELSQTANLTVTQVSNWFKNKRQRARAKNAAEKSESDDVIQTKKMNELCKKRIQVELEDKERGKKILSESSPHMSRINIPLTPVPILKVPYTRPILRIPYARYYSPYPQTTYKQYHPIIYKRTPPPLIYRSSFPSYSSSHLRYEKTCKCNCQNVRH